MNAPALSDLAAGEVHVWLTLLEEGASPVSLPACEALLDDGTLHDRAPPDASATGDATTDSSSDAATDAGAAAAGRVGEFVSVDVNARPQVDVRIFLSKKELAEPSKSDGTKRGAAATA